MGEGYVVCYKYLKEYNLMVEKHSGIIRLDILIKSVEALSTMDEFSNKANFLIDLRTSKFSKNIGKVKDFVIYMEENFPVLLNNKIALLTEESDQVAMATLFKMLQPRVSKNIHVFSTLDYATLWLNIEIPRYELEEIVKCTQQLVVC